MARAGYCGGCGGYVYLRPDGFCVNGHPPQSISGIYDAPDESAPPAAFGPPPSIAPAPQPSYEPQQPSYGAQQAQPTPYQQQPPYGAQQPYQPPQGQAYTPGGPSYGAVPPKKGRGGLVAIILIALLLVCGVGGAAAGVVFGVLPNPATLFASPAHQKVAAAGDFIEAFSTANIVLFRKSLPTDAANAANPAYWIGKLSQADGAGNLESKTWAGDRLTMVFSGTDGSKRQFVLVADPSSDKVTATAGDVGSSDAGSPMNLLMVKEPAGYKVLALVDPDGTEFVRFTPATIKQFETENP